ncbi:hypothetical protein B9Z19DRAFT_827715 [Tuber borchii]|uniref:Uncharacterized protein n=1 Tax=Tuber borchii TaxID=42251 RepID=A0A2T6ZVA4_TUBBO|nr:hypothetical protein B9Z19DRAFT_827715 [Tuber borchii]
MRRSQIRVTRRGALYYWLTEWVLYVYFTRYDALFKPNTPNLLSLHSTSAGAGALLVIVFISLGSHPRNSSGLLEKLLHGFMNVIIPITWMVGNFRHRDYPSDMGS